MSPTDDHDDKNQRTDRQYDKIINRDIAKEMRASYIDYSMSVIVARALPDVRDGLKPVHRRILYAMNELNLDPSKAYKKSARIVGDTMGKYHPHGEASIYDAMVRMAQDFSMRYMLVDGHGNFGSMDGDGAAAQRYTEARLSRLAVEMLADIEKDTVDFQPNYDEEFVEPKVLPSRFPNLLVNGSSGIAVGMATNIPPHNLTEVINGVIRVIDNRINGRKTGVDELLGFIKGPDFPTGASILGTGGVRAAYRTGRGKVIVRALAEIEPINSQRDMIVVTELPYQVNKARLVEKIGELASEKKIEGISDIRDESNRNGVRIVIELKKDTNANVVLNKLYKNSQLQESFGINMLALVNNEPRVLNLAEILDYYIDYQEDVITRRTRFELAKAQKRLHILEGLLIALDNIDEVIAIIRASKDTAAARASLTERFGLTDEQSSAIVEMRLRSLTGLERERLQQEHAELSALVNELTAILSDEKKLYAVIKEEILVIKAKYGDERRTRLVHDPGEILEEDMIDEEDSVITMTHLNYIKRLPLNTYRSQNRGGKGIIGMNTRDEDDVKSLFIANTHDTLLFFTSFGRAYSLKTYEIPEAGRGARGTAVVNLLNLNEGEKITAIIPVQEFTEDEYLFMLTKRGVAKKTPLAQFSRIMKNGIIAINFRPDDELMGVVRTDGRRRMFVATKKGLGLKFDEAEVRQMGRIAAGVRAVRLMEDDVVVGMDALDEAGRILFVSERGYGKCTDAGEFQLRHRGGKGVKIYRITEKTGDILGVLKVSDDEELMLINSEGVVLRIRVADISKMGRIASGVKLINLPEGVNVVGMARITREQIEKEQTEKDEKEQTTDKELNDEL